MPRGRKRVDERGLTVSQAVFVAAWVGDIPSAAKAAGVMLNTAQKWVTQNPAVKKAILERGKRLEQEQVSSANHALHVLTKILDDTEQATSDRIAAADKILKSHGAYLTRIEHSASDGLGEILAAARARVAAAGADKPPKPRVSQT